MSVPAPLAGTTVVDLSLQLPGPWATLLLAALGAEVTKVEPPGGDPAREIDPQMFERVNAGKQPLRIDLKDDAGRARLHELVAAADVFVESFRPGVAARLGAGWDELSRLNPRLVYCSLPGFAADGPLAARAAHDLNFLGLAGAASPAQDGGDAIRVPFVDLGAGTSAALAIVAALHGRERGGGGRRIEMPLLDTALSWSLAKQPRSGREGAYGVFATADGAAVAISVLESAMWRRLCDALGWEDWAAAGELGHNDGRRQHGEAIERRLRESVAQRPRAELLALAERWDLAVTVVNELDAVGTDPQLARSGIPPRDGRWRPLGREGADLALQALDSPTKTCIA